MGANVCSLWLLTLEPSIDLSSSLLRAVADSREPILKR